MFLYIRLYHFMVLDTGFLDLLNLVVTLAVKLLLPHSSQGKREAYLWIFTFLSLFIRTSPPATPLTLSQCTCCTRPYLLHPSPLDQAVVHLQCTSPLILLSQLRLSLETCEPSLTEKQVSQQRRR